MFETLACSFQVRCQFSIEKCRSENLWCMEETWICGMQPRVAAIYHCQIGPQKSQYRSGEERYSANTAMGLLAPFSTSAARANSRDDALAHVLPVRASRARHEEPLTYENIFSSDPGKERRSLTCRCRRYFMPRLHTKDARQWQTRRQVR